MKIVHSLVGTHFIGEFLKTNDVLKTLDLSQNTDVGDDGVAVITDALLYNKTLTELWIGECGVSVKSKISIIIFVH